MSDDVIDVEPEEVEADLPAVREPTSESTALVARQDITVQELVAQSHVIVEAMKVAMKENVHYGRIPGVNKPTLLKPGAEKLLVLFRLSPEYNSDKIWHDDGHLTVSVNCSLHHIPTGLKVAEGEGLCTTRESRYAYRKGGRSCPECGEATIIKGKAEYGGGWLCFKKKGGCGAKWDDGTEQANVFESMSVEREPNPDLPDAYNCVTPETRILTRDLRWVPAGELVTGDVLIGVNEDLPNKNGRRYEESTATIGDRFADDLYEIQTTDGRAVRCNGEHRWLVKSIGSGVEWVPTETIYDDYAGRPRTGRPRRWQIMSVGVPWVAEGSYDAGYMAGLLDADGCLGISRARYHSVVVQFAQQAGLVLSRFVSELGERAFGHRMYPHANKVMREPVYTVAVAGGLLEQMRLLGTLRPPRLIERWDAVDMTKRRFEGRPALVESVRHVGRGELVRLGTTSHTYIAEGMVCHNTVLKMADKRALLAAILNGTAASDVFTQDMEESKAASGTPETPFDTGAAAPAMSNPDPTSPGFEERIVTTFMFPNAPSNAAQITERLRGIDDTMPWGDWMDQCADVMYEHGGGWRDLDGERRAGFFFLLANVIGKIEQGRAAGDFPPPDRVEIQQAFAWALEGEILPGPAGSLSPDEALGPSAEPDDIPFGEAEAQTQLDAERNQDVTRDIG